MVWEHKQTRCIPLARSIHPACEKRDSDVGTELGIVVQYSTVQYMYTCDNWMTIVYAYCTQQTFVVPKQLVAELYGVMLS